MNAHLNTPAVLRGIESLAPVVEFPKIQNITLDHSVLSLSVKIALPSLKSLRLANESILQVRPNGLKNLKHLELDKYMNTFSLIQAKLDTVKIHAMKSNNEGLILLIKLLTFQVCLENTTTTVFLDTLYTPWDPDLVGAHQSHGEELDRLEACTCDLAGDWDNEQCLVVVKKLTTG